MRALAGSRRCPRDTPPVLFLGNAMKSIVSADRESRALQPPSSSLSATGTEGLVLNLPSLEPSAEETLIGRHDYAARLAALEALFEDDEEAQMVLMSDMDELDAATICEMQGWSRTQLATIRRRIRRRIDAGFPTGFRT